MSDKINIKVTPSYCFDTNKLGLTTSIQMGDLPAQIATKVMDLQEKTTTEALKKLGWTPPRLDSTLDYDTWWETVGCTKAVDYNGSMKDNKELCRMGWEAKEGVS